MKAVRKSAKDDFEDDNDDEESDLKLASSTKSKLDKFKLKANHEATSDEDD